MMFEFIVSMLNCINLGSHIPKVLSSIKVNLFRHSGSKGKTKLYSIHVILINLEPIGGSKPKFSQKSESLTFTEKAHQTISLLCPAMGSPLPSFRFVKAKHNSAIKIRSYCQGYTIQKNVCQ